MVEPARPWRITGSYFESCNCTTACPCVFGSPPTRGYCRSLQAWHVEQGYLSDTDLSGLTVVQALIVDGNFWAGDIDVLMYVDVDADERQREVLEGIFTGAFGGPYKFPGRLIREVLKLSYVPVEFEISGHRRAFRIPSVMEFSIAGLDCHNPDGSPPTVRGSMHFVDPLYVAKAESSWFRDEGQQWDHGGLSAFYGSFELWGP